MTSLLTSKREGLEKLCARYGVARLEAFGSALRDDFKPSASDLDLLVAFGPMAPYARVDAYFGLRDDEEPVPRSQYRAHQAVALCRVKGMHLPAYQCARLVHSSVEREFIIIGEAVAALARVAPPTFAEITRARRSSTSGIS